MDEKSLGNDNNCNTIILQTLKILQGMTKNVELSFNVDDTIPCFTISIQQDNYTTILLSSVHPLMWAPRI